VRIVAIALAALLAAGCSNTAVGVGAGVPPAPPGTSIVSGASGLTITTTSGAAALAMVLTFGAIEYARNPQSFPSPSALIHTQPPAPELAQNRRISEQDCSKPVDLTLGNLRCK
jgi:hypothetical protein